MFLFAVYTAPGGFPGKIKLSRFLCHRCHVIRYWIQTLVTLVTFRHHSEDCRSAVHRRSIALLRSSETFFFNPLNPKGAQCLISPRINNPESFIKIAYRQRQPKKLWLLNNFSFSSKTTVAGRGERGVGWGGMYREGHKYGFPNKTTKRVLLRSKMSTLKSMRGGIH